MRPATLQHALRWFLAPFGTLYGLVMALRARLWQQEVWQIFKPECPCVAVGNIAWGGTGKTPLVDWLLCWAENHNLHAVVLTRGYKARLVAPPTLVTSTHSAETVGDEPLMLQRGHPKASVLVDPVRRRSGAFALERLAPDLLILDDGMQHMAVARDLDLVVLRPEDLTQDWNRVIPAGPWRENASALARAGAFLIKASPDQMTDLAPLLSARLECFQRPVFSFSLEPAELVRVGEKDTPPNCSAPAFGSRPYALMTGVGNPAHVLETVTAFMHAPPVTHRVFPDHHRYTPDDVLALSGLPIVCTAKDAVKLLPLAHLAELWALHVRVTFGPALWTAQPFPVWWDAWWNSRRL